MQTKCCCVCGRRKAIINFKCQDSGYLECRCLACKNIILATRHKHPSYGKNSRLRNALIKVGGDARVLPEPWRVSRRVKRSLSRFYRHFGIQPPPNKVKVGRPPLCQS